MMNTNRRLITGSLLAILLAMALHQPGFPVGGLSGSGGVRGMMQRLASIVVNGEELTVDQAQVTINGESAMVDQLKVGHQINVNARFGDIPSAETVEYFSNLIGPVASVDGRLSTVRIFDQTIVANPVTNFDGIDRNVGRIPVGTWLEVSGLRNAQGELVATYLGAPPDSTQAQVVGRVTALPSGMLLEVEGTQVDISTASLPVLDLGDRVMVLGSPSSNTARIMAESVSEIPVDAFAGAEFISLEGIARAGAGANLMLDDFEIAVTETTAFVNGTASDLEPDTRLEVLGFFEEQDQVTVTRVTYKPVVELDIEGPLESIELITHDSARIQVGGFSAVITQGSDFEATDDDDEDDDSTRSPFNLHSLAPGDYLEVSAYVDGADTAVSHLQRAEFEEEVEATGLVTGFDEVSVTVMGQRIPFSPQTEYEVADESVSLAEFREQLAVGQLLEVSWDDYQGPATPADELSVGDDD